MIKKLLIVAMMALTMMACDDDGKFEVQGDVVVYSYWTFSFGPVRDTLPGADPATFKPVNSWLGHDSERAYFKDRLITGADVATLQPKRYPLSHDDNDYYYMHVPLHVADVQSFKTLKWFEDDLWAIDSRYAYFDSTRIDGVDLSSFKVIDMAMARDNKRVYYFGKVLPDADPASFEQIGSSAYYRDKAHIWCGSDLLQDVDYDSFEVDDNFSAHDKRGSFYLERRDTVPVEEPVEVPVE